MNRTLYLHPEGFALAHSANTLTASDDNGHTVQMPIGPAGLLVLAAELTAIANDVGNLAEQAGGAAAVACLNAMLGAADKSARIELLQSAIAGLQSTAHPERAAAGFAVVLADVVARGLEALK